jgi:hypothetical protein
LDNRQRKFVIREGAVPLRRRARVRLAAVMDKALGKLVQAARLK